MNTKVQRQITVGMVDDAIQYARATWRSDGAEGETVHLLCDAIEQMRALAHCSWCGATVSNTPGGMSEHLTTCEKREGAQEEMVRRSAAVLETAIRALARAPCHWPEGVPHECSEGDPCLTHEILGWPSATVPTGSEGSR